VQKIEKKSQLDGNGAFDFALEQLKISIYIDHQFDLARSTFDSDLKSINIWSSYCRSKCFLTMWMDAVKSVLLSRYSILSALVQSKWRNYCKVKPNGTMPWLPSLYPEFLYTGGTPILPISTPYVKYLDLKPQEMDVS
jgi:hypothetical protein